jgi:acetoin utilization deacetylase AcuC-like enzyme
MLATIDAVMAGELALAFCAVRPPGHHVTATRGMGFCVFNHVAVGARYLQSCHGCGRIAIIDWDVHHGNGAAEICSEDLRGLDVSLHEQNIYPLAACHHPEAGVVRGAHPGYSPEM